MKNSVKVNSLKFNLILNTFLQIINVISPLLTAPYISRVLGASQVGIYSYIYSINYYFVMIAGLGTATYGIIEIARVRNDPQEYSKSFFCIELITVVMSIICIMCWVMFSIYYKEYTYVMLAMTFYLLAVIFDISWFYLGIEKVQYTVFINAFFKILGVLFTFLFVNNAGDLINYSLILSVSMFLGNASMWMFLPKFIKKVKINVEIIYYHFKGTIIYFIPTVSTSVYTVLNKTLIGLITGDAAENGYYEQASKIINLVRTVTFTSLNTLLGSRMSYLFSVGDKQQIIKKRNLALDYVLFFGIGACFGLMGISSIFVPIFFGEEYINAIAFLVLMSPLLPIMGISNLIGNLYYNPSGQRKKSTLMLLFGCLVNLIFNFIFIPLFRGKGAIIASLIGETVITLLYVYGSRGFVSFRMLVRYSYKKIIAGLLMMIYLLVTTPIFDTNIIILILQLLFGTFIYLFILIILKDNFMLIILKKIGGIAHGKKKIV